VAATELLAWLAQVVALHLRHALPGHGGSCHLLRHAQRGSTQIYTHVTIGCLQEVHGSTHLRARSEDTDGADAI
jgi:site-specific recombinase XerD